jgi:hypothetical protein
MKRIVPHLEWILAMAGALALMFLLLTLASPPKLDHDKPAEMTVDEKYRACLARGGTFTYIGVSDAHSYECKIIPGSPKDFMLQRG